MESMINDRGSSIAGVSPGTHVMLTVDDIQKTGQQVITPIVSGGDAIGSVILMGKDDSVKMGETENALARCAAGFMGRQMEQ